MLSSRDHYTRRIRKLSFIAALSLAACGHAGPASEAPALASDFLDVKELFAGSGSVLDLCGVLEEQTPVAITLTSFGRPGKLVFELDLDHAEPPPALERWSLVRMRGRYTETDGHGRYFFRDGVVVASSVRAGDYPSALTVPAHDLARAFWPMADHTQAIARYSGRVIEVEGVVEQVDERDVFLRGHTPNDRVRCRLANPADATALAVGSTARLKGFCAGHELMTIGVTLYLSVVTR